MIILSTLKLLDQKMKISSKMASWNVLFSPQPKYTQLSVAEE